MRQDLSQELARILGQTVLLYEEKLVIPETVSSSAKVSRHTVGRRRVNDGGREGSAQAEAVLCSADKG